MKTNIRQRLTRSVRDSVSAIEFRKWTAQSSLLISKATRPGLFNRRTASWLKVRKLAEHTQGQWGIEISQHHILDVTYTEDASRICSASAPEIPASIRRMAFNILQRDKPGKDKIRGKCLCPGWDETVLDKI